MQTQVAHSKGVERLIRRLAFRALCLLQLDQLLLRQNRNRLVLLMYHGFTDDANPENLQNFEGNHLHIDRFREQLRYLERHHTVMRIGDALETLASKRTLPKNPVVLTMDDGYESNYTLAFPLLHQLSLPASIFVTTGFVERREPLWPDRLEWAVGNAAPGRSSISIAGETVVVDIGGTVQRRATLMHLLTRFKRIPQEQRYDALVITERQLGQSLMDVEPIPAIYRPLTWKQITTMAASGLIDIGNHTHSHWVLSGCTTAQQRDEIETAHGLLSELLGATPRHFCYPNGQPKDYNVMTKQLLHEFGYRSAITTIPGANDTNTDLFELRRYAVNNRTSLDGFRVMIGGGLRSLLP